MSLLKEVFAAALITTTLTNTSFAMDYDLPSDGSKKPIIITKADYRSIMDILPPATSPTVKNTRALMAGTLAGAGGPSAVSSAIELEGQISFKLPVDFTVAPTSEQISEGVTRLRSAIDEAVSTVSDTSTAGAVASHADTSLSSKGFNTRSSN